MILSEIAKKLGCSEDDVSTVLSAASLEAEVVNESMLPGLKARLTSSIAPVTSTVTKTAAKPAAKTVEQVNSHPAPAPTNAQDVKDRAQSAVIDTASFGTTFMSEILEESQAEAAKKLEPLKPKMVEAMSDRIVDAALAEADRVGGFFGVNLTATFGEAMAQLAGAVDVEKVEA